jgi:DNA polymerase IIIc chi subunit
MNTEVWFYLLADATEATRQQFIWRFCDTAYRRQRQAVIYCPDTTTADQLDEFLWLSGKPENFLPHSRTVECPAPILLLSEQFPTQGDVLLNLTDRLLTVTGYQRIVEVINPESREASRHRWRHYQQQGLAPELKPI